MKLITNIKRHFTKCLVIHPVSYPNKGPILQQYLAQQAIGLASSLDWEIVEGPFWKEQIQNPLPKTQLKNQVYVEPLYDGTLKDGSRVKSSIGNGVLYKGGIILDMGEEEPDDLHQQWKNKILRNSLANSSLMKVKKITQKLYFSKGKVDFLAQKIKETKADCLFVNTELKAGQVRNLVKVIEARVNDRSLPSGYGMGDDNSQTQLQSEDAQIAQGFRKIRIFDRFSIILQIFAQRSSTKISKLQIELSYLNYLKTRLVRTGSTYSSNLNMFTGDLMKTRQVNMEIVSAKQRRAFQTMSGEGQSQLELQKRNIKDKQAKIRRQIQQQNRLRKMKKQKQIRRTSNIPVVALVGYTNVGKSAFMNKVMKKNEVSSKDLLFQTLKTTSRYIQLPSGIKVNLLDTIGFITNLPIEMVESFQTTLEDVAHADIIIHLRDISHPQNEFQKDSVLKILKQLHFQKTFYNEKMIEVWNKVDLVEQDQIQNDDSLKISCKTGQGLKNLLQQIDKKLKISKNIKGRTIQYDFKMHQKVVDWLKEHSNISYDINFEHDYKKTKQFPQGSVKVELQLDEATFGKLSKFVNPEKVRDKSKKGMPPPDW